MYNKSDNLKRLQELSCSFPYTCPVHDDVVEKLENIRDMINVNIKNEDIKLELANLINYIKKK